jgi:hypothetical protein
MIVAQYIRMLVLDLARDLYRQIVEVESLSKEGPYMMLWKMRGMCTRIDSSDTQILDKVSSDFAHTEHDLFSL